MVCIGASDKMGVLGGVLFSIGFRECMPLVLSHGDCQTHELTMFFTRVSYVIVIKVLDDFNFWWCK